MLEILNYRIVDFDFDELGWLEVYYFGFNFLEGLAWLGIAGYVLVRWGKQRTSKLELVYASLFIVFGLTDFAELWHQTIGLLLLKGIVLASLLYFRHLAAVSGMLGRSFSFDHKLKTVA